MRKKILTCLKYILPITFVGFLLFLFYPRTYNVPSFKIRENTNYWDLNTGSKIGYTMLPAKGVKKPYPIIFLQGGPGGPIFDKTLEALSEFTKDGFDVYAYDQVGCGHSGRLEDISEYTVDRHKKDLEEIVKKTGASKIIIIAQSWGAMLAVHYITDHSDKVEKIIFTGPGPILPIRRELENIPAPDSLNLKNPVFSNRQGNEKANNLRTRFISFCARNFDLKLAGNAEMDDFASYLNYELNKSTVFDTSKIPKPKAGYGYYMHIKTVQSFDQVPDERLKLKNCKIPILILKGQYDSIKWGYLTEYLEFFKDHKLVIIPNAGHSITSEQRELYIKNIKAFLKTDTLNANI